MNASGAAVSACSSSSSPYDSLVRQASASNAGLPSSSFSLLSCSSSSSVPGGCALSLAAAVSNRRFFHSPHRRTKDSVTRKGVVLVKGSSSLTFELEEHRRRHDVQITEPTREREDPVVKGRVAWSTDGKAKILWGTQKPQERASQSPERQQSHEVDSLHGSPRPSAGEFQNSFSGRKHQRTFLSTSRTRESGLSQQTKLCNPSTSGLPVGSPSTKQAAERDAFRPTEGPPISLSRNEQSLRQDGDLMHGASPSEEGNPQSGPTSTFRLEEILKNFRTTQKWGNGSFQNGGTFATRDVSAKRSNINRTKANASQIPARKDIQSSNYRGSTYTAPLENSDANDNLFASVEGHRHRRVLNGEGRSITGQRNPKGQNANSGSFGSLDSSLATPLEGEMDCLPVSRVQSPCRKMNSTFEERRTAKFGHTWVKSESVGPVSKARDGGKGIGPSRYNPVGADSKSKTLDLGKDVGHLQNNSNRADPESKGRDCGAGIGQPQYNSSSADSESKARDWGSGGGHPRFSSNSADLESRNWGTVVDKSDTSEWCTETPYTNGENQNSHSHISVGQKFDIDAEDTVDFASPSTSDSEDESSCSVQSKEAEGQMSASLVRSKPSKQEPLLKDGKATWHSHSIPGLPFEFQYSYSEAPSAPVIRYREKPYSPFGPVTLSRPWTGGRPLTKSKKNLPAFDSFKPPPKGRKGIKYVQNPGPYPEGQGPKPAKSRDEILGEPLTSEEIAELLDKCQSENRQLNLGRDGLTHNMLDLIHSHWKRRRVIKVRCLGVPTLDMDNVCFHLEDKTGGKIIFRRGGVVYLFRGRNYNYKDRPEIPLMLWKPPTPVYPKLIRQAPGGLTKEEADQLRLLGKKIEPLCTLRKNGVYLTLVNDVRAAFKVDKLARINCEGLNPSDYKKIGAKLRDLVPCVLLSFDDEQILMWKGKEAGFTNVGFSDGVEAAAEGSTESLIPDLGSASLSTNDLRADGRADVLSSGSAIEEIWPSSYKELSKSNTIVPSSASDEDECTRFPIQVTSTSSLSLDTNHAYSVTGENFQTSHPELVKSGLLLGESGGRDLAASNEVKSSLQMALAVQNKPNMNGPSMVRQDTPLHSETGTMSYSMPGCVKENNVASVSSFIKKSEPTETKFSTDDQEREVGPVEAAISLESISTKLDTAKNVGTLEEGLANEHSVVYVGKLWDQAIASRVAVQLEAEMDDDAVFRKAGELANAVPVTEEYTKKILRKLCLKTERISKPDDEMLMHFRKLQKLKLERKLSKRSFRMRPAVRPEDRLHDVPQSSGGMPVDELVQLLSMR